MIPSEIQAGDSLSFAVSFADYSGDAGWELRCILRGPQAIDIESEWVGQQHLFKASAIESGGWPAGEYACKFVAVNGADRKTLPAVPVKILADLASAGNFDVRSHVKRMLDAIEATLEKRATKDQQSYEVEGKRLDRIPINDLLSLQSKYTRLYRQELEAAGLKPRRRRYIKPGLA